MKKIYTILTSLIIVVLIVHMTYMTLMMMNLITPNEDFAQNLGYVLMDSAILHGIYGLFKWIYTMIAQGKLLSIRKQKSHTRLTHEAKMTLLQRILGAVVLMIIVPHTYIKFMTADVFPFIADICYIIALLVHLWIGFPKWMVSLGLRPAHSKQSVNVIDGGNQKWK
ncbi:MAG: hypothetical protein Q4G60_12895 [bacterium]|nr:hypothetical protein [bacterium]